MKQMKTAFYWVCYGLLSVVGQAYLWGSISLLVWLGWDVVLVDWLNAEHFTGRERDLAYGVAKALTAFHILITIALLLLELRVGQQRVK